MHYPHPFTAHARAAHHTPVTTRCFMQLCRRGTTHWALQRCLCTPSFGTTRSSPPPAPLRFPQLLPSLRSTVRATLAVRYHRILPGVCFCFIFGMKNPNTTALRTYIVATWRTTFFCARQHGLAVDSLVTCRWRRRREALLPATPLPPILYHTYVVPPIPSLPNAYHLHYLTHTAELLYYMLDAMYLRRNRILLRACPASVLLPSTMDILAFFSKRLWIIHSRTTADLPVIEHCSAGSGLFTVIPTATPPTCPAAPYHYLPALLPPLPHSLPHTLPPAFHTHYTHHCFWRYHIHRTTRTVLRFRGSVDTHAFPTYLLPHCALRRLPPAAFLPLPTACARRYRAPTAPPPNTTLCRLLVLGCSHFVGRMPGRALHCRATAASSTPYLPEPRCYRVSATCSYRSTFAHRALPTFARNAAPAFRPIRVLLLPLFWLNTYSNIVATYLWLPYFVPLRGILCLYIRWCVLLLCSSAPLAGETPLPAHMGLTGHTNATFRHNCSNLLRYGRGRPDGNDGTIPFAMQHGARGSPPSLSTARRLPTALARLPTRVRRGKDFMLPWRRHSFTVPTALPGIPACINGQPAVQTPTRHSDLHGCPTPTAAAITCHTSPAFAY